MGAVQREAGAAHGIRHQRRVPGARCAQLSICWSAEVKRVVQTMVYEDGRGEMQDILRPENHAQVIRAMWDEPAAEVWPRIACKTLIVPAGPTADRANTEFAAKRRQMVEAAARAIKSVEVRWIPETIHDIGYHKPAELADIIRVFLIQQRGVC